MRDESNLISRLIQSPKLDVKWRNISTDSSNEYKKQDEIISDNQDRPYSDESRRMTESNKQADIEQREPLSPIMKLLRRSVRDTGKVQDKSIGLRLALPDKVDVMRGLQAPSFYEHGIAESPYSKSKKLIIVPDYNIPSPLAHFRRVSLGTPSHLNLPAKETEDEVTEIREEIVIRTSEQEPSVHQLVIPSATDLLIHARICSLLEGYDHLLESRAKARKTWFDFSTLVGMDRAQLETMYLQAIGKKPIVPISIGIEANVEPPPLPKTPLGNPFATILSDKPSASLDCLSLDASSKSREVNSKLHSSSMKISKPHPSIIRSLLECADDLLVEGFFTETIGQDYFVEESNHTSCIQASVFSSQRQRQFVVCFRGSRLQHAQPVKKRATQTYANGEPCLLHQRNPFPVCPIFKAAYFEANVEKKIFDLLDKLSTENPFCDVVFTGHSFGGVLATFGAMRYAEKYPMMTVSCHVFGTPKVGGSLMRQFIHSLPNLNVVRVEYGLDYCVDLPLGPKWEHVGHTIKITPYTSCTHAKSHPLQYIGLPKPLQEQPSDTSILTTSVAAFKFGKQCNRSASEHKDKKRVSKVLEKDDHEMRSYLHALEQFTHLCFPWVCSFTGEDGDGIVSRDNEERFVS